MSSWNAPGRTVWLIVAAVVALVPPARAYDADAAAKAFGEAAARLVVPAPVKVERGWQGADSAISERRIERILDAGAWSAAWEKHAPGTAAPAIDFAREMAVAIFGGKSDASTRISLHAVSESDSIEVTTMTFVSDVLSAGSANPYLIAVLPRSRKQVVIVARSYALMSSPQLQYRVVQELPALTRERFVQSGNERLKKGEHDRAIADFSLAIEIDPNFAPAYDGRSDAWEAKGDYDRAIADLDQSIKLNPNNAGSYNDRCWIAAIAGRDLTRALGDCDHALRLSPFSSAALDSRGFVNLRLGRLTEAIDDYTRALGMDPKMASALYGRGLARLKSDAAAGNADIAAAKTFQRDIAEAFVRYGVKPE